MKKIAILSWILLIFSALSVRFFYPEFLQHELSSIFHFSVYFGYAFLLFLGCIRGFTLIPSTYLIILGLLFFPPWPLFLVIMIGTLVSSVSIYYFSEFLRLDHVFKKKYAKQVLRVSQLLKKNELPIIIAWSAFPLLPTDVICYIAGALRINVQKFLVGIFIGEGITSGLYIFFGSYLLHTLF